MSIYQKIFAIQIAIQGLTKDAKGNSGEYVSGNKILAPVRKVMDEQHLLLIPEVEESTFTRTDYATSKGQKTEMFCSLKIKFTWVDVDTGETLVSHWASSGMNQFDKGFGSALTYGERYYLLKLFHIPTDKDDVDAPKTEEEEATVQSAIANINACTDANTAVQWFEYYKQFPKIGKDKDFLKAYNKKIQELNGTEKQQ